jgi:hypothetical protein
VEAEVGGMRKIALAAALVVSGFVAGLSVHPASAKAQSPRDVHVTAIYGNKTNDGGYLLESVTPQRSEIVGFSCIPHQDGHPDCFLASR